MTPKDNRTMKHIVFALAFLFGLSLAMASCGHGNPPLSENPKVDIVEDTLPQIEEETVDTISWTYDDAEDTVMIGTYVFASQPVPEEVETRMRGRSFPANAKISMNQLRYLTLPYYDFDGNIQKGEMVCNKVIAHDLLCIFKTLFSQAYPIYSMRLVDDFEASDEASMQANNTSCFNYRYISGTRILSRHAYGMAVDINPLQNPCIRGKQIQPSTAEEFVDRNKDFPHKIDKDDYCKKVFTSYRFRWGGNWRRMKDYQHFER